MMRLIARKNRLNLLALATLCCLAWQGVAKAQEVPFTGIIVEDSVPVRAGAGRAYYVVGELKRGAIVQVEAVIFGWNKIKAPQGVYSYISKAYVDAQGEGNVGTVNDDRVQVNAAGLQGPGPSYRGQVLLNKGDKVQIVASEGSYYKIQPPADAFVFLPPGAVRRASGAEAAGEVPAELAAEQPSESTVAEQPSESTVAEQPAEPVQMQAEPTEVTPTEPSEVAEVTEPAEQVAEQMAEQVPAEPAVVVAVPDETAEVAEVVEGGDAVEMPATQPEQVTMGEGETQVVSEEPLAEAGEQPSEPAGEQAEAAVQQVQTTAVSAELRGVEQRYLPAFGKPVDEQPIAEMMAAYEAVGGNPNLPRHDQRIVRLRLAALKRNKQIADTLEQIKSLRAEAAAAPAEAPVQVARPANYDAVGKLMASSVYDGQTLPRMYRLIDPASGRTLAYLQPNDVTESRRLLGKVVGIEGPMRYDSSLKLRVIEVKRVDMLEAVTP